MIQNNDSAGAAPCDQHAAVVARAKTLVHSDRAAADLKRYLTHYGGKDFDELADRKSLNEFTVRDFRAVRTLSVCVRDSAKNWLRGAGRDKIRVLLDQIPAEFDIWDVKPEEYEMTLGRKSPAWKLWEILYDKQAGARHAGRGVTAGKLLHGKRPRLIPIFDRKRVAAALKAKRSHFWEAIWCTMRDPEIRQRLEEIQREVSEASGLSLLRVFDIIVWMSSE